MLLMIVNAQEVESSSSLPVLQKFVNAGGKHTACGEQHELRIHTNDIPSETTHQESTTCQREYSYYSFEYV